MQSHAAPATTASRLFPPLALSTFVTALIAGVLADGTWEFWARVITPLWVGGPLQPAALVQSVFGFSNLALAEAIHLVVGVVFYPLGYLFIAKPIADRFLPFSALARRGAGLWCWTVGLRALHHGAPVRRFAAFPELHHPDLGFAHRSPPVRAGRRHRRALADGGMRRRIRSAHSPIVTR